MEIPRPISKQPIPEHAKCVFKGVMFDVYQWEQELYDGTKTTFEKLKRPDTVLVYGVLPGGKILLVEDSQPLKKTQLCAPGGRMNAGESPEEAGARELLEETGYVADEFILWKSINPITKIDWAVYVFVAKGLKKVKEQNLDSGEKIKIVEMTLDEVIDTAVRDGWQDREIERDLLLSKIDPQKHEELKKLFSV
jgi:ADP-ribose pyrophosphatase